MRECRRCGEEKPLSGYYTRSNVCKSCKAVEMREYRLNNKEKFKKSQDKYQQNNVDKHFKLIKELTGLKCTTCGFTHTTTAPFDWHHTDSNTKQYSISKLMDKSNTERLLQEIDKCVFLCSNCHRIEHERLRIEKDGSRM